MNCSYFLCKTIALSLLIGVTFGGKAGRTKSSSGTTSQSGVGDTIKCFCKVPSNVVVHCPGDTVECDKSSGCLKTQTGDYRMQVCAPKDSKEDGCRIEERDGKKASVCTCHHDLCNGQSKSTATFVMWLLVASTSLFWRQFFFQTH